MSFLGVVLNTDYRNQIFRKRKTLFTDWVSTDGIQMNKYNFLISLALAEGGIDVGGPMLKIEKCYEGVRAPPTSLKSENKFRSFDIPFIVTQSVF